MRTQLRIVLDIANKTSVKLKDDKQSGNPCFTDKGQARAYLSPEATSFSMLFGPSTLFHLTMNKALNPVWDIPTRLFHWLLVVGIGASWLSAENGAMEIHQTSGLLLLTLLLFRLLWGLIGSQPSRFSSFLKGPAGIRAYLSGDLEVTGHNPLGGWSVVVLLLLPLALAVSGLMNTDDIAFDGPLYDYVSEQTVEMAGFIHEIAFNALLIFVALHIAAIVVYRMRGKNLVKAMISGHGDKAPSAAPKPLWLAGIALIVSVSVVWGPYFLLLD